MSEAAVRESSAPVTTAEREPTAGDWIAFMAMAVGLFMAILDIQIVASSLAQIQAGIGASAEEISWIQTSYLIAEVIMIPLSGWLARLLSTRWLFVASAATFTAASAACAFAWSLESMIVFRALQGFLGGAMIPTVFSTSFKLFPRRYAAGLSIAVGMVATTAPTLGPVIGGWLTQVSSWHWLFLVNLLPGITVALLVGRFLHMDRPNLELLRRIDIPGVLLVALFLGTLQYVLEEGPGEDWFDNGTILAATLVSAASAVALFWRELTIAHPVVDLRAFTNRNFATGSVFSFIIGVGLYGSVYVLPLYLYRVRGYDSLEIGLTMMVTGVFQFLSAPLAGALSKKMDLRAMLAMGLGLFGAGLWMNSYLTAEWGWWDLFLPQAVRGLALMFCFLPINTIALGLLPPEQLNNASGLYNLMRNLGGAIGLAAINTAMTSRFDLHQLRLAETVTAARGAVTGTLEGLSARFEPLMGAAADSAALKMIHSLVAREALVLTFDDAFKLMSGIFVLGLLLMPFVRKVDPGADVGGGH